MIALIPSISINPYDAAIRLLRDARLARVAKAAVGGNAMSRERYMRDAKLMDIGAGTNEIRRMLIGRELIGA
jgi:alkylation response protein AidB-like acyl-CoA dehydrogenase